jgi:hypothetical protein
VAGILTRPSSEQIARLADNLIESARAMAVYDPEYAWVMKAVAASLRTGP